MTVPLSMLQTTQKTMPHLEQLNSWRRLQKQQIILEQITSCSPLVVTSNTLMLIYNSRMLTASSTTSTPTTRILPYSIRHLDSTLMLFTTQTSLGLFDMTICSHMLTVPRITGQDTSHLVQEQSGKSEKVKPSSTLPTGYILLRPSM